jgi:hypothetical protein
MEVFPRIGFCLQKVPQTKGTNYGQKTESTFCAEGGQQRFRIVLKWRD